MHFGHRVIHWGSAARSSAPPSSSVPPRIALSWVSANATFEQPAFARSHLPFPPCAMRVALVAAQGINYSHQEALRNGRASLFYRLFKTQAAHFSTAYCDKVEWFRFMRPPPKDVQRRKERAQPDGEAKADEEFVDEAVGLIGQMKLFGTESESSEYSSSGDDDDEGGDEDGAASMAAEKEEAVEKGKQGAASVPPEGPEQRAASPSVAGAKVAA